MCYKRLPFYQYFADQSLGEYGGKPRFKLQYKKVEYMHKNHKHDAYYCVRYDKKREVFQIYFKQTCSKSQWLSNFEFPDRYYDSFQFQGQDIQLRTACGWGDMYCAFKWYIRNELKEMMEQYGTAHEVEIIGWSLGSAIAQLCCQDLWFNFGIKSHVFTFGSVKPWFGHDQNMKNYLAICYKECYNFKNREDIVGYMVPLPGYFSLEPIKLKASSNKFWLFKLFQPNIYHTNYWNSELYKTTNEDDHQWKPHSRKKTYSK